MISLFDAMNDSSSDSDDVDYVPTKDAEVSEASDDELVDQNCEDIEKKAKETGMKRETRKKKFAKNGGLNLCEGSESLLVKKEETRNADDVWKSFLDEVETEKNGENSKPYFSDTFKPEKNSLKGSGENQIERKKAVNIFEFAGETISVNENGSVENVTLDNVDLGIINETEKNGEAQSHTKPNIKRKSGLDSVLGTIMNKKQKLSTLQKTLLDWKSFKKDEGIQEELLQFNRGKSGFLERQKFLERSNLRCFEIEKEARLSKMKKS